MIRFIWMLLCGEVWLRAPFGRQGAVALGGRVAPGGDNRRRRTMAGDSFPGIAARLQHSRRDWETRAAASIADPEKPARPQSESVVAYCTRCKTQNAFGPKPIPHARYLILSIPTAGLSLILWLAALIGKTMRPLRCQTCGWHKPEFRHPDATLSKPNGTQPKLPHPQPHHFPASPLCGFASLREAK